MEDTTSELRQRLVEIARSYGGYIGVDNKEMWIAMFERIEKEVAAQKQRWEAEARIAEAQLPQYRYGLKFGMSKELETEITPYCQKRVAELRAALDGVIGEPGDHQSSKKLKAVTKLRKNEQPDSQAYVYNPNKPYCLIHGSGHWTKEHTDYSEPDSQAGSRQQTAQVLERLKDHVDYNEPDSGTTERISMKIDAELAALRVGLEGKSNV